MRFDDDMLHATLGKDMRPLPQQELEILRNQLARELSCRKSGAATYDKMKKITTKQLRKENREDRRNAKR